MTAEQAEPSGRVAEPSGQPTMLQRQATFKEHAEKTRHRLKNYQKGVIDPMASGWMGWWDTVTFMCLMFTAIFTPWEVAFIEDGVFWTVANAMVTTFFAIDIILNFFVMFKSPQTGRWVSSRRLIARHYATTWLPIDLISVIDFEAIVKAISGGDDDSDEGEGDELGALQLIRTVRLVRLFKLLRILRASRIISRWQDFIGLSYSQTAMIQFVCLTLFQVHIMACLWGYIGLNWRPNSKSLDWEASWVDFYEYRPLVDQFRPGDLYVVSIFVAINAMFSGVGSVGPCNLTETGMMSVMMVLGSIVWAWVIGSLCGLLATLNPHQTSYRNMMDALNHFMSEHHFDTDHRVRMRQFLRQTQDYGRVATHQALLSRLSSQLRGDTALLIAKDTLDKVPWLSATNTWLSGGELERQYLAVVALNMRPQIVRPQRGSNLAPPPTPSSHLRTEWRTSYTCAQYLLHASHVPPPARMPHRSPRDGSTRAVRSFRPTS